MPRFLRRSRRPPDVRALVEEHLDAGDPTGWFEPAYAAASPDPAVLPWALGRPHPGLVGWLDDPVATPPGRRAVVVGCGLGDDAVELARRGFEVTALDIAPSALRWARRRFPTVPVTWEQGDVLSLPNGSLGAFDLVVEVHTVPYLPGVVRDAAMDAIGRLAGERGVVVVLTLVATDAERARAWDGPPWAQAPSELAVYRGSGLVRLALEHGEPDEDGGMEVRVTWQRPEGPGPGAGPPDDGTEPIGGPGGLPIVPSS